MDIRCRKTTCVHNKGHTCCASCVNVNKDAFCLTFEKQQEISDSKNLDLTKKMFETAPEYENSRHIRNVVLTCNATKCVFNCDKKCMANGITVVDDLNKSCCATYLYEE